jgi:hypothetical protein
LVSLIFAGFATWPWFWGFLPNKKDWTPTFISIYIYTYTYIYIYDFICIIIYIYVMLVRQVPAKDSGVICPMSRRMFLHAFPFVDYGFVPKIRYPKIECFIIILTKRLLVWGKPHFWEKHT